MDRGSGSAYRLGPFLGTLEPFPFISFFVFENVGLGFFGVGDTFILGKCLFFLGKRTRCHIVDWRGYVDVGELADDVTVVGDKVFDYWPGSRALPLQINKGVSLLHLNSFKHTRVIIMRFFGIANKAINVYVP